jgi:hypothetical protein
MNAVEKKIADLKWLLPKCKYILINGNERHKMRRFDNLITLCDELIYWYDKEQEESEATENNGKQKDDCSITYGN